MKQKYFFKIAMLFVFALITTNTFGQTTVSYDFSDGGAVTGLNEAAPGITLDTNIGFGSFKNSGSSNPGIFSSQLRLYQNATKGGSIIIYANNGVTITDIVINASGTTGPAGYTVDGGAQTNLSAGSTYSINGITSTSEVEFFQRDASSSNRIYIDSFSVTYTAAGPATPGITLGTPTGNTNEDGTTATFTAVLNAQPATNVVLNVSSGDTGEVTISPSTLTFTNGNWDQTQTITASGIDDALIDGNIDVTITLSVDDASSDDTYDGISETTTVTNEDDEVPPVPSIIITELADPDNSTSGRFVELYNTGSSDIDLAAQNIKLRRYTNGNTTFTDLTLTGTIAAKSFYIVGKSTFTGIYGFTPNLTTTSSIADGNGDDQLALIKDGTIFDIFGVIGEDGSNTCHEFEDGRAERKASSKVAKSTWNTADWNVWSDASTASGCTSHNSNAPQTSPSDFDPGAWIGAPRWKGTTNSTWSTTTNWDTGILPSTNADVFIDAGLTNYPIASTAISVNNVTIASGSSLIAQNTFTGNVTYNRNLGTTNWYLVSSPVSGETMTDMRTNNSFDTGSGTNIGFATYNPGLTGAAAWTYFTSSSTDVLSNGKGYSAKLDPSGDISFNGTINTADVETSTLSIGYNLIGNPYTSYISSKTFLEASTSSNIDQSQIWIWNQSSAMYEVKTSGTDWVLAPTQGFFVNATSGGKVTFEKTNQASTGNTFQKSNNTTLSLWISDGQINRYAKIEYTNNATKGFDFGWEGELFGGVAHPFAIYSQLLNNNEGKNYQIQSLPNSDFENMIIPIGLNVNSGKEITFTAEALNLPSGINIYLEDRQLNTFTRLDETNSEYKLTLTESLNGIGRFYLHTASKALSTNQINLENVSIYKTNNTTLKIVGIHTGFVNLKLFNVLGKQIMNTSFQSNGVQEVSLPITSKGIYIVQLETEKGKLNKKIILE